MHLDGSKQARTYQVRNSAHGNTKKDTVVTSCCIPSRSTCNHIAPGTYPMTLRIVRAPAKKKQKKKENREEGRNMCLVPVHTCSRLYAHDSSIKHRHLRVRTPEYLLAGAIPRVTERAPAPHAPCARGGTGTVVPCLRDDLCNRQCNNETRRKRDARALFPHVFFRE